MTETSRQRMAALIDAYQRGEFRTADELLRVDRSHVGSVKLFSDLVNGMISLWNAEARDDQDDVLALRRYLADVKQLLEKWEPPDTTSSASDASHRFQTHDSLEQNDRQYLGELIDTFSSGGYASRRELPRIEYGSSPHELLFGDVIDSMAEILAARKRGNLKRESYNQEYLSDLRGLL